jgi:hypothetical protein
MDCQYCQKSFSTSYAMKKKLTTFTNLTYHLNICKSKSKPLECNACLEKDKIIAEREKTINEYAAKLNELTKRYSEPIPSESMSQKKGLTRQNELGPSKKPNFDTSDNSKITEYTFDTFCVPIRNDGMINATALCTAGNKLIADYLRLSNTKAYLEAVELDMGIPISRLLESNIGGHNGTWVHRKIGYHLAQWISPQFAVKVSTILDELFVTGSVVIGQEKTSQHIELMYQEKVKTLQDQLVTTEKALELTKQEHTTLMAKHNSTLKNHRYVKFKEKGPCFYIIESGISSLDGIERKKFGIAGTDQDTIDDRLKSHRTLWPQLKVNYIIFMKEIEVLENSIKRLYKKEINPNGHEIIEGVSTDKIYPKNLWEFLFYNFKIFFEKIIPTHTHFKLVIKILLLIYF